LLDQINLHEALCPNEARLLLSLKLMWHHAGYSANGWIHWPFLYIARSARQQFALVTKP
jgi:hypothetical protein